MDEVSYSDGIDVSPQDIFRWSDQTEKTPKTSAPSLQEAMDLFEKTVEDGDELICFAIGSHFSSSYNVMRLAAEELEIDDRTYVVDSETLSCGIGLLILEAAKLAEEGLKAADIYDRIEELKKKVNCSFIVDTLTYLFRGGRCDGLSMMVGSALQLHPKLCVENGVIHSTKKYRGRMNRVINEYMYDLMHQIENADRKNIFIIDSGCDQSTLSEIRKFIDTRDFENVHVVKAGGVISSHCGPGAFGLMFLNR